MSAMRPTGRDLRALARAADALTTQVRRLAKALTTTPDDAATTPVVSVHGTRDMSPAAREALGALVDVATRQMTEAPAVDEDALRATRRESARIIIERATRGIALRSDESALLRQHFDAETREHDTARSVAAGNKRHVQVMYAELVKVEARATKAERAADLLADSHRHAEEIERERNQQAIVLAEVLRQFTHETHPGRRCLQSGHVPVETVERWRSVVQHDVERPWWQQLDEARAELKQAQAAITRVRTLLAGRWGSVDPDKVRAALDGTEQPTTEA